jgi:hypothetical protein
VTININPTRESFGESLPIESCVLPWAPYSALGALSDGKVSEVVQQFDDLFTFNDYALAVRRRRPVVLAIVALRRCPSCSNFHFSSLASNFTSGRHLECSWTKAKTQELYLQSTVSRRCRAPNPPSERWDTRSPRHQANVLPATSKACGAGSDREFLWSR